MLILDLPQQMESYIMQLAEQQGETAEQYVINLLQQQILLERPFNYDLKEMQQAIDSGVLDVPQNAKRDFAQFQAWLNQLS